MQGSVEQGEVVDAAAVEMWSVELAQDGAVEAFTDRVVVRGAWRDPVVDQIQGGPGGSEVLAGELGSVVGQDSFEGDAVVAQGLLQVRQKRAGDHGGLVADDELDHRDPSGDIDRGQLPHGADAFEAADVEGVQADHLPGARSEQAEPERAFHRGVRDLTGVSGGQGGQGRHAQPGSAQVVPVQDLGHSRGRAVHPSCV